MSFGELDWRMSNIKRWCILPTHQQQSVAEHCFNVERIARFLATEVFGVTSKELLHDISQWALHHDDEESLIGDIPTTGKRYVQIAAIICPPEPEDHDIVRIVKLADLMEAYFFLIREAKMGNKYIGKHLDRCHIKALKFMDKNIDGSKHVQLMDFMRQQAEEVSGTHEPT